MVRVKQQHYLSTDTGKAAQKKASSRYEKTLKRYIIRLRQDEDRELIDRLQKQKSVNAYIKKLIRKDIDREGE